MKTTLLTILTAILLTGCSKENTTTPNLNNSNNSEYYDYNTYVHKPSNCVSKPELSCNSTLKLTNDSEANFMPGGDIMYSVNYTVENDTITLKYPNGNDVGFSFKIIDASNIKRIEDETIWTKKPLILD